MAQTIGIRVKRAPEGYDLGAGKFGEHAADFGAVSLTETYS